MVPRRRALIHVAEEVGRPVVAELARHVGPQDPLLLVVVERAHREEVGVHRIAGQVREKGLAAEDLRQIVGLRVEPAERPEHRPPQERRHQAADEVLAQVEGIAAVPGEVLVAAVAREGHGDPLAGGLRDVVGRHGRGVGEGLVVVPRQLLDGPDGLGRDVELVMVGTEELGNLPGILDLVVLPHAERDRVGPHRLRGRPRHHRHDGRGVDAARQEGAQRHVADHPELRRLLEPAEQLLDHPLGRRGVRLHEGQVPVRSQLGSIAAHHQLVSGRKLPDRPKDGLRGRDVEQREVVRQGLEVEVAGDAGHLENRLDLRREDEAVLVEEIVEGLLPHPIPGDP